MSEMPNGMLDEILDSFKSKFSKLYTDNEGDFIKELTVLCNNLLKEVNNVQSNSTDYGDYTAQQLEEYETLLIQDVLNPEILRLELFVGKWGKAVENAIPNTDINQPSYSLFLITFIQKNRNNLLMEPEIKLANKYMKVLGVLNEMRSIKSPGVGLQTLF